MADFSALIASIEAYVRQNGNNEITGNGLQEILDAIVNVIGGVLNDTISDLSDEVTARTNADGTLQDNIDDEALARAAADTTLDGRITTIEEKIPTDASDENQLADKAFVSALIAGITALIPSTASSLNKLADKEFVASLTDALQNTINALKDDVKNGYVYAGIAAPSTTPKTGKVFYFALQQGKYTNFRDENANSLVLTAGINILKFDESWSAEQIVGIDDESVDGSNNIPRSGGVFRQINAEKTRAQDVEAGLQSQITSEVARAKNAETVLDNKIEEEREVRKDEIQDIRDDVFSLIHDYQPIVIEGNVVNAPDEEDITQEPNNLLKFKDKAYNPTIFSGLGRKYLRKNVVINEEYVEFDGFVENPESEATLVGTPDAIMWDRLREMFLAEKDGVYYLDWQDSEDYLPVSTEKIYVCNNIPYTWNDEDMVVDDNLIARYGNRLMQEMISQANTIYIIQYDFDLNGETVTIPENCILEFDGGSLSNGTIVFNDTLLAGDVKIPYDISGTVKNDTVHVEWFDTTDVGITINALLQVSGFSKIVFKKGETYQIETGIQVFNKSNLCFDLNGSTIVDNIDYRDSISTSRAFVFRINESNNIEVCNGNYERGNSSIPKGGFVGVGYQSTRTANHNSYNISIHDIVGISGDEQHDDDLPLTATGEVYNLEIFNIKWKGYVHALINTESGYAPHEPDFYGLHPHDISIHHINTKGLTDKNGAVRVSGCYNVSISDSDLRDNQIQIFSSDDSIYRNTHATMIKNVSLRVVYIKDIGAFEHPNLPTRVHKDGADDAQILIQNCTFIGCAQYAYSVRVQGYTGNIDFINCSFIRPSENARILVADAIKYNYKPSTIKFDNCLFDGYKKPKADAVTNAPLFYLYHRGIVMSSCTIRNCTPMGTVVTVSLDDNHSEERVVITGNQFDIVPDGDVTLNLVDYIQVSEQCKAVYVTNNYFKNKLRRLSVVTNKNFISTGNSGYFLNGEYGVSIIEQQPDDVLMALLVNNAGYKVLDAVVDLKGVPSGIPLRLDGILEIRSGGFINTDSDSRTIIFNSGAKFIGDFNRLIDSTNTGQINVSGIPEGTYKMENGRPWYWKRIDENNGYWIEEDGFIAGIPREGLSTELPQGVAAHGLLEVPRDLGFRYYVTDLKQPVYLYHITVSGASRWVTADGLFFGMAKAGTFAQKPVTSSSPNPPIPIGYSYFCTDRYIDPTDMSVKTQSDTGMNIFFKGNVDNVDIWVDCFGRVVS